MLLWRIWKSLTFPSKSLRLGFKSTCERSYKNVVKKYDCSFSGLFRNIYIFFFFNTYNGIFLSFLKNCIRLVFKFSVYLQVILTTLLKVYVRGGLFEKSRKLLSELEALGYGENEVCANDLW